MSKLIKILSGIILVTFIALGILFLIIRSTGGGEMVVEEAPEDSQEYLKTELPLEFTVATYNIQGRPLLDDTRGKFPEIGLRTVPYDIIAFQECFVNHGYLWQTMEHPVKVFDGTLRNFPKIVGPGLSNAGRFPLAGVEQMHFTSKGELQNRPASKGILLTRFDIGGHIVDVYNTHMEAGSSPDAAKARFEQVEELIAFVADNSPPENSVIFLGDFNMRPLRDYHHEDEINSLHLGYKMMLEGLGEDFYDAADIVIGIPDQATSREGDSELFRKGREVVDRILFRSGKDVILKALSWEKHVEEFRDDSGELLSDHDPISVKFRLERRQQ